MDLERMIKLAGLSPENNSVLTEAKQEAPSYDAREYDKLADGIEELQSDLTHYIDVHKKLPAGDPKKSEAGRNVENTRTQLSKAKEQAAAYRSSHK